MTEGTKKGAVKFYNAVKQFGFINGDDGKSYFFHASQIEQGTRLNDNDKVSFVAVSGDRGPKAEKVKKIKAGGESESEESEEQESNKSEETEEAPAEDDSEEDEENEE